jgi:hypothetical protein
VTWSPRLAKNRAFSPVPQARQLPPSNWRIYRIEGKILTVVISIIVEIQINKCAYEKRAKP